MKKKAAKNSSPEKKDFLVVGLGASAGGVKALQEFFAAMPANSGMAYVVILHLSPNHESNLDRIIQAQTQMPVIQVNETHKVEPNHVYVIPPNQHLEMVDGVVRVANKKHEPGLRAAIDVFFRTLAEAYEKNAVCVVLSGTGSDGTLGLKRVKESNGFAVVQDPEDAEYDQMPRSAIATNLADWVLPVAQMPEKLIHFRESSERLHLTNGADAEKVAAEINAEESLREILTVLRVRTGHDFSNYKKPTLIRRIARHLQIHELEDIPSYMNFLRDNPDEIVSLQRNLLINVTNFFRDKEAFDALEQDVIPHLFEGKTARDTVRVWSAACASGEEAYSLAMLLQEYAAKHSDPPKFQVFATDVDDEAIHEAREHSYPETIEADVSPERLKRFFIKEGKQYIIKKELRETILFAPHNVLRDPPFSKLDLITCRNLLIYLNRETQERLMEIFHFALAFNGFLFLGSSETAESLPELFTAFDKKNRIYQRRPAYHRHQIVAPQMPIIGNWQIKIPEPEQIRERNKAFSLGEVHYKLLEKFAPPSVLVNHEFDVMYMSETVGRYLRFTGGEPSNNILKLVLPELLPDLRAALFTAQQERQSSEFPNIHLKIDGADAVINLIVRTVDVSDDSRDLLLVVFEEVGKTQRPAEFFDHGDDDGKPPEKLVQARNKDEAMEAVVTRLEEDLARTRAHLRSTIEQHEISIEELKASNEELQAINEELRSATEELETSKEELQSVNEELVTVNHELKEKIDETGRINSDLSNLMAATDIATIFLDRDLQIKRYTPPVEDIFNLTRADIGRPLAHFTHSLDYQNIQTDATQVLKSLKTVEREIAERGGRYFLTRIVPYRTLDDRINGVVLNFIDITERRRAQTEVAAELLGTQTLQTLSARLVKEENFQTIYDEILNAAVELTKSDAGTIQIYDSPTKELVLLATRNITPELSRHFQRVGAGSRTACGIALKTGKRSFVDFDDEKTDESCLKHLEVGLHSAQSTPLVSRTGKPIGMLNTHWKEPKHRPTTRELRFLDLLARQAADSIERHQAEAALRESEANLAIELADAKRLQKISSLTIENGDSNALYEQILDTAMEVMRADFGSLQILSPETGELHLQAWRNFHPASAEFWKRVTRDSASSCGVALKRGERIIVTDAEKSDLMAGTEDLEQYRLSGIRSVQTTPLISRSGHFVGMFSTHCREPHTPSERDLSRLDVLARQAADLIEQRQAKEALRESEEKFRSVFDSIDEGYFLIDVIFDENNKPVDMLYVNENPAAVRMTGESYVGRRLREIDPNYEEYWYEIFGGVALTGEPVRMERYSGPDEKFVDFHVFRISSNKENRRIAVVFTDINERKQREEEAHRAEEAVRASEKQLEAILEVLPTAIFIADERGGLQRGNRALRELWGVPPETTDWHQYEDWVGWFPETGERIKADEWAMARALQRGESTFGELVQNQKFNSDERRYYINNVVPLRDEDGRITGGVAAMLDVTESKQTEEILRESEEQFRRAIEDAPIPVIMQAEDGQVLQISRTWTELTGYAPEDIPNFEAWLNEAYGEGADAVRAHVEELFKGTRQTLNVEFPVRTRSGDVRHWSFSASAPGVLRDNRRFIVGMAVDITERANTEEALRKSEEQLQMILESTNDYAIIAYDVEGRVTRWNAGAERIFGYSEEEAVGQMSHFVFTPEDIEKQEPEREMATALEKGRAEDERWHVRKDGSRFFATGVLQPLRDGKIEGFVKICRDQTGKLQAEEAMRAKEMLKQFVAAQEEERRRIARDLHDHLGQQLTALRLKLETVKKICGEEKVQDEIKEAQTVAEQLDRDVDFLAWELRPASLDDLGLRVALGNFVNEWEHYSGVKTEFHATGLTKRRLVHEIETNLYRIAQEALNNIYKHARAENVSVLLERRGDLITLIIEDDGVGFKTKGKKSQVKGMGLVGMSERAKICGGELEIESVPKRGTTVFARIPVQFSPGGKNDE